MEGNVSTLLKYLMQITSAVIRVSVSNKLRQVFCNIIFAKYKFRQSQFWCVLVNKLGPLPKGAG